MNMSKAVVSTNFNFPGQTAVYHGKVRDVYTVDNNLLVAIVTDRISAFDVVLPKGIPYKGQVINQIAAKFLELSREIVPNWMISTPHPMVTIGHRCEPFAVEMIIRGYLTGSLWRDYRKGARSICGVPIPEGMKEHQAFPKPIITPTTKAKQGAHDLNISGQEIVSLGLVSEDDYAQLEHFTYKLFELGTRVAHQRGLILVDTKYEFGRKDGKIYLIDEANTPDSSRYFYLEGYQERLDRGEPQRQLSKEFVREWLMENNFMGNPGEKVPEMTDEVVNSISQRYVELYESITGETFKPGVSENINQRMEQNVLGALSELRR